MSVIGIVGPSDLHELQFYFGDKVIPRGLGGTVLPPLISELIERGHKVILFTLDRETTRPLIMESDRLKIWIGPYRPRHRARDFFAVERQFLKNAIASEKLIDFMHAHWTYEFALAALDSGKPTLVTAHDAPMNILRYNPTPYRLIRTLMAYSVAAKAQFISAVSEYVGHHFKTVLRYSGELFIIPNGLRVPNTNVERMSKTDRPLVFVAVLSGFDRRKNSTTLLKAFSLVRQHLPSSELWLVGPGHGPGEEAQKWAKKQNLEYNNVRFMGYVPNRDLPELLTRYADIFVHPALEESFGMTIAEAMMLGLPVIAGKHGGGVPYTLDHGKAGLLVDVRSSRALAQAMLSLANSPEMRKDLGQAARKYAIKHYSIDHVTNLYENVYNIVRVRNNSNFTHQLNTWKRS